jgi:tyrosyl-tRNA synthetase
METKLASSRSEARRIIEQGGLRINGNRVKDWQKEIEVKKDLIIQIGKRKFLKIK